MKKFLIYLLCLLPMSAGAEVIYRVQKTGDVPESASVNGKSESRGSDTFAAQHRFYVGGMYNLSMWQDAVNHTDVIDGETTSGFDVVAGFRIYDIFRIEADYMNARAEWDDFAINTNTVFLNAIVDARINSLYRFFYKQKLVPYVGVGAGMTFADGDGVHINNDVVASLAAMAGFGIELGEHFTIDLGYRYVYMFGPDVSVVSDLHPSAHQFRAGVRINF
jgi:opacity protein-like surface antigen